MGYTHYWYRPPVLDEAAFKAFVADTRKILAVASADGIVIGDGSGDGGTPTITDSQIAFNGVGAAAHETFWIAPEMPNDRHDQDGLAFEFCKTAQKPYDVAVTAALIAFKRHFGDAVRVSSDGEDDEWQDGRDLAVRACGYGAAFHFSKRGEGLREEAA